MFIKIFPYYGTEEYYNVNYKCEDGFSPSNNVSTSMCTKIGSNNFNWIPALEEHHCTSLKLEFHEKKSSNSRLFCPLDTISYKCTVNSTEANMYLEWVVIYLGQLPQSVIYNRNSIAPSETKLSNMVTITLDTVRYEYMESTVILTQLPGIDLRKVFFTCKTLNLEKQAFADAEIPLGM